MRVLLYASLCVAVCVRSYTPVFLQESKGKLVISGLKQMGSNYCIAQSLHSVDEIGFGSADLGTNGIHLFFLGPLLATLRLHCVYNEALESRESGQVFGLVQETIMKHFGLPSVSTAAKQIMQCRKRGLILTAEEFRLQLRREKLQREYDKAKETIERLSLVLTTDKVKL